MSMEAKDVYGQGGEESFWQACLHWEGYRVQKLGHHDRNIET